MMKKAGICLALVLFSGQSYAEFPTEETVRFVLGCMADLGAQNDHNMYTCVCRHDVIEAQMPNHDDYNGARIFERFKVMPGEKGAFFRDNELGEKLFGQLQKARELANQECPVVRHLEAKKPDPSNEVKTMVD